jgi:CheY-like chemotaxis protein
MLSAETGREAIETLQQTPDVDVVLMDIMMPDMDGLRHDARDPQAGQVPQPARSSP